MSLRLLLIAAVALGLSGCDRGPAEYAYQGRVMGTTWSVKIVTDKEYDETALGDGVQARLDAVNEHMSTWLEDSEVSRFNQLNEAACMAMSEQTMAVVSQSQQLAAVSGGAFDITVGPLIRLWGFDKDLTWDKVPTAEVLDAARESTGYQLLELKDGELCKQHAGLQINLSAIAKGYAVDQVAAYLQAEGFDRYLVEVGGELYGQGTNIRHQYWGIGIEAPVAGVLGQLFEGTVIPLNGRGMATSGDYRNYFEKDGVRYSHTIDPVTARPITHTLASVTVLADNAMLADAWATVLNVMGPEKGMPLANQQQLAVLMLVKQGEGFVARRSDAMEQYLSDLAASPAARP